MTNQLLNGHADPLTHLADRVTDLEDRKSYAELIAHFRSLPPGDELLKLAELLGLLSLLGQRLPDAAAELLAELRQQAKAAGEYHAQVDQRLDSLPKEIAAGVDPAAIANGMSERFRQQIAASGLQDVTALLKGSVGDVQALSGQFTAALKPLSIQFKSVTATISAELTKLTDASRALQEHNARLLAQQREESWLWKGLAALILVFMGVLGGIQWQMRQTADALSNIEAQVQRIQTPQSPPAAESMDKARRSPQ